VSPYAAGCALCGADLDAERQRRDTRVKRFLRRPLTARRLRFDGQEIALVAILLLLALFAPPLGFLLALLVGFWAHANDNRPVRNVAIAAALLAVIWTVAARELAAPVLYGL
jgi:hypothetical protein